MSKFEIEVRIGTKPFVSSYAEGKTPQQAAYSLITCFKPQSLSNIGVDNLCVKDKQEIAHQFKVSYQGTEIHLTAI